MKEWIRNTSAVSINIQLNDHEHGAMKIVDCANRQFSIFFMQSSFLQPQQNIHVFLYVYTLYTRRQGINEFINIEKMKNWITNWS